MSYSPTLGRFLERDPMEYTDEMNDYQFELSNPIDRVDPFGTDSSPTSAPATGPTTKPSWDDIFPNEGPQPMPQFPTFPGDSRAAREAFARAMLAHFGAWMDNNSSKCGCSLDAQTLIAQWMMESNWGRSKLTQATWNFGNIKGQGPAGSTNQNVPEHIGGRDVVVGANFRKYNSPEQFYEDYYKLICGNDRYKGARGKIGRDYFQALKDAGYATDLLCPDPLDVRRMFSSAIVRVVVHDAGWKPVSRHGR
jgi:hypothetical protein